MNKTAPERRGGFCFVKRKNDRKSKKEGKKGA
jgi:hypothetical protein